MVYGPLFEWLSQGAPLAGQEDHWPLASAPAWLICFLGIATFTQLTCQDVPPFFSVFAQEKGLTQVDETAQ